MMPGQRAPGARVPAACL